MPCCAVRAQELTQDTFKAPKGVRVRCVTWGSMVHQLVHVHVPHGCRLPHRSTACMSSWGKQQHGVGTVGSWESHAAGWQRITHTALLCTSAACVCLTSPLVAFTKAPLHLQRAAMCAEHKRTAVLSCVPESPSRCCAGMHVYDKILQDTKIRVVLDGPPAPPSPVPEVNEQDDSESTRTGTASAGGHHDAIHPAAAIGTGACVLECRGCQLTAHPTARHWPHNLSSRLGRACVSRLCWAAGSGCFL